MLINLRLYWLTLIFEDNSPPRFKARGQATLCALMLATFASWQTPGLYKFYMVVASFPLILMEIETVNASSSLCA